jgi:LTXXQ motif family protein
MRKTVVAVVMATLLSSSALTGSALARDRSDRPELSASQITDQFGARTARIKAELRLTPEQGKNWPGFESAMNEYGKTSADRRIAGRTARAKHEGSYDVIERMRMEAKYLGERSVDRKAIADAAQPLYVSLDDRQKRRFAQELLGLSRWPDAD